MRNSILHTILFFMFSFLGNFSQAQEHKLEKAGEEYQNYGYIDAAEIYLEVVESGYTSPEILKKIGNTYYFNAKYQESEKWYAQLFELTKDLDPIYYLRYSQSLNALGNEKEAFKWYKRFRNKAGLKETSSLKENMMQVQENSGRYRIEYLAINSEGIDFGGAVYDGNLIFASTRKAAPSFSNRKSGWDNLNFLDFYKAPIIHRGTTRPDSIADAERIKGKLNTKFHESSACFTKDGKTIYFTRNNSTPKEISKREAEKLKIYRATMQDGEWTNIEDLSINSDLYSTAHPALSPDGKKLYFASNMPGTLGETDIFVVAIDAEGNLADPVNLGDKVNTPGRETFPFVSAENELYFSSNGHFGLGGLDVFYVQLDESSNEVPESVLNIGTPINSAQDDFAFTIDAETKKGFFSSNRKNGAAHNYDDIYSFFEKEPIKNVKEAIVYGVVTDKQTQLPLKLATVYLLDENNLVINSVRTDSQGNYSFKVERNKNYLVRAEKEEYDVDEKFIEVVATKNELNFELNRNIFPLKPGSNLAEILNIPIIYFDFDKSNIRPDAAVELEKVIAVMKKHPQLKIDIRSHTDSRGSDAYNEALSGRRAKSTMEYILNSGIAQERLSYKGYGESQLINQCSDGVPCTSEEHQKNRRSEFIVVE